MIEVIPTPTLEDYLFVIEWAFYQGMRWSSGSKYFHEDYWDIHKQKTHIIIKEGYLMYCSTDFAIRNYNEHICNANHLHSVTLRYHIDKFRKKFNLK